MQAKKRFLVLILTLLLSSLLAAAQRASQVMEQAIYTEETTGDLDVAMELYRRVLALPEVDRHLAALAQYRLALCHLKKGDEQAASQGFRSVVESYPEEQDLVALSRRQLEASRRVETLVLAEGVRPHPELDALERTYYETLSRLEVEGLRELYAEEAYVLPPWEEIELGPEGSMARTRQFLDLLRHKAIGFRASARVTHREVYDEVAHDLGYFDMVVLVAGQEHTLRGKFLLVFRRDDDGTWGIHIDTWNMLPTYLSDWESLGALIEAVATP